KTAKPRVGAAIERTTRFHGRESLRMSRQRKPKHRHATKYAKEAFHGTAPVFRRRGDIFMSGQSISLQMNVGGTNHFRPFLRFVVHELAECGGRQRHGVAAEFVYARL